MTDPLERLTNLVALLLETRVPLTQQEIIDELQGQYPATETSRRAAFERDKALLRDLGIPITMEVLSGHQAGQTGYRIARSEFELGDLGLTGEERQALQLATAAVHLGGGWADDAITKLGGRAEDAGNEPGPLAAMLPALANLPPLFDAVAARRAVEFTYHGKHRDVEPWGLLGRGGFWYVIGHDRGAGERRTYRVDRIAGAVEAGSEHGFERPADFDPRSAFPVDAKLLVEADGPTEALVLIDADRARAVALELGEGAIADRRPDGHIVVRVPCTNRWMFRSWLLGFVEHAEVLEPADVRQEVVSWLEAMVSRG